MITRAHASVPLVGRTVAGAPIYPEAGHTRNSTAHLNEMFGDDIRFSE